MTNGFGPSRVILHWDYCATFMHCMLQHSECGTDVNHSVLKSMPTLDALKLNESALPYFTEGFIENPKR